jgi:hypothetical protein
VSVCLPDEIIEVEREGLVDLAGGGVGQLVSAVLGPIA